MSKIAVISDIHANYDSLKLVLKDIEKRNVDKIICLGDLVTKYFYPDKVVDMVKENCSIIIKGNCDKLVVENENYKYARSKLGIDRIDFLDNLSIYNFFKMNNIDINLFHASLNGIDELFNPLFHGNKYTAYKDKIIEDYSELLTNSKSQVSIVGHTHQNYIGLEKNNRLVILKDNLILDKNKRSIINVGSVGEHSHIVLNNNNPETIIDSFLTYLIIDDSKKDKLEFNMIKVPYKETLKEIYFDMVKKQLEESAPYSPKDTKKLKKSLSLM